jgi:hypothetical protein
MRTICFTSFTFNYLPRARVLARTLRRVHPDWEIWAIITDRRPRGLSAEALAPFHRTIRAVSLGIPDFESWVFRHDLIEAATAVKGRMLLHLLNQPDVERVVYLDPDIAVFAPLDPVLASPDGPAVVLTPHQISPNSEPLAIADNERTSMRYGIYNLGFLSVAADAVGREFAQWWAARLEEACYDAIEDGLFTDQKYCDLAPSLFSRVHISRDPGCNVASWNLSRRRITLDTDGRLQANGEPLRFYHFTKVAAPGESREGIGDAMTELYAGDNVEVHELLAWYKQQLEAETDAKTLAHPWSYGRFADGTPIPRAARLLWRADAALRARFGDPFADAFQSFLRKEHPQIMPQPEQDQP